MTAPERVVARILSYRELTHRVMYEAAFGQIPSGLTVDHLCHDPELCREVPATACPHRACCNPAHLQAVTARANVLRGGSFAAANAAVKTDCPSGHPYDSHNTYVAPDGPRQCRTCRTEHVYALRRQIA